MKYATLINITINVEPKVVTIHFFLKRLSGAAN